MFRFKTKTLQRLISLVLFVLLGCNKTTDLIKSKVNYKKTLDFSVNGHKFKGIGVPLYSKSYLIEIAAPFKLNYVKIESCHREKVLKNVYHKKRIIKNRKIFQFNYNPIGIERECILFIMALNENGKGRFAQIVFQSKRYNLNALNFCNGKETKNQGVSICQSKKGLTQLIQFDDDLVVRSTCPIFPFEGKKIFKYDPQSGDCIYLFLGRDKLHKLVSYGYDEIIFEDD